MASEIPRAVWSGEFTLFGVAIKCHVLNTGERVIDADSVGQLVAWMNEEGPVPSVVDAEVERFARWLHGVDPKKASGY